MGGERGRELLPPAHEPRDPLPPPPPLLRPAAHARAARRPRGLIGASWGGGYRGGPGRVSLRSPGACLPPLPRSRRDGGARFRGEVVVVGAEMPRERPAQDVDDRRRDAVDEV